MTGTYNPQEIPNSIKTTIESNLTNITNSINELTPQITALQTAITNDNYSNLPNDLSR